MTKANDSNLKYPSRYEIQHTLSELCTRAFVSRFAQAKGVFVSKANQDELAAHLSGFFLDSKDLEEIRDAALKETSSNALSGFVISTTTSDFNPIEMLERLRLEPPQDIQLSLIKSDESTLKEKSKDDSEKADPEDLTEYENLTNISGTMQYLDYKPGKIEFLQREKRSVGFKISKLDDGNFQVFVEGG